MSRRHIPTGSTLAIAVILWWLLLGGTVVWLLPEPSVLASGTPSPAGDGRPARIYQPGMSHWPVPVSRAGFDAFQRGVRESDEAAMEEAFATSEWIDGAHGQAVTIIAVDGEAIQVEFLEGPYAGRRAWLKERNLRPSP